MANETFTMSDTQKPLYNPFETDSAGDQVTLRSGSFKDDGWPSLPPFGDGEFAIRESLGILPNTLLVRDSLTSDFLPTNFENLQIGSPRESLGILNLSSMDLGRESIGIFDINKPLFKREEFGDSDRPELHENRIPQIFCHAIEDKANSTSSADLNRAFLFPHSRKISGVSSGSSANPSFNSRSLEEFSKLSSISSVQKDLEPTSTSILGVTDPFNEAFQICQGYNSCSALYKSSSTHYSFASDLEIMRKRIQSLPSALEENNPLCAVAFGNKTEDVSFDDVLICRGVEDEKDLDDSVFLQDKGKRKNEEAASFDWGEKSFDGERYLLDCTPQPDWGEWESSKSNVDEKETSPLYSREGISKKVDKMLGMQPVNLEERLKLKNVSKCDSASSVNTSQNISKISRASQCSMPDNVSCGSNNFSQDLSKISRNSEENISKLIKNLSDIINEKENLSKSQRNESHHMLNCLAGILRDSGNKGTNSEDSGHSSVEDPHLDDKNDNGKICEALDLSCKRNDGEANKSILSHLKSPSVKNPPPYSPNDGIATEPDTKPNNLSQSSNRSNVSAKSIASFRRHSNISQNKVSLGPEKFKRAKSGIISKKEPLRAVLPVENMAKDTKGIRKSAITPERNDGGNKLTLKSKRTSTPLQEPKLKPVAASTPTSRQSKDNALSPAARPKLARSYSHQSKLSATTEQPLSGRKSGENPASKMTLKKPVSRGDGAKFVRRNSITEVTLNKERSSEDLGPQKLKRSFSTGRESKIFSALSKVRQNILNSPYYRKSTDGNDVDSKRLSFEAKPASKVSQTRKMGKENLKP